MVFSPFSFTQAILDRKVWEQSGIRAYFVNQAFTHNLTAIIKLTVLSAYETDKYKVYAGKEQLDRF